MIPTHLVIDLDTVSPRPDARLIPGSLTSPIPVFGTSTLGIPGHHLPLLHVPRPRSNAEDYALQFNIVVRYLKTTADPHLIRDVGMALHPRSLWGAKMSCQPAAGPFPRVRPPLGRGRLCIQRGDSAATDIERARMRQF